MCQKINIDRPTDLFAERSAVYDMLRRLFLFGPSTELLTEMVDLALNCEDSANNHFPLWEKDFIRFLATLKNEQTRQVCQELKLEFTRLFIGPYHLAAPPYEAVYRSPEHALMQEATLKVRAEYQAAGLVVKNLNREPDDHIGLELEFMYYLNRKAFEVLQQNNFPTLLTIAISQERFLTEHLAQWVPTFCDDITANTRQEFFRRLAEYVKGFILDDCIVVKELLRDIGPE